MRTAYINKQNKVVYIAAFVEDKIKATDRTSGVSHLQGSKGATNAKAKFTFNGEEVFEVDGSGLGVGDVYTPPTEPETIEVDSKKEELAQKEKELAELRTKIMIEKTNEEPGFEERVKRLVTLRDALLIEIEELKGS